MSGVKYGRGNMSFTLYGLEDVYRALGDLGSKTPAAAKVAINAAARETRKLMIARAKARYAVNAAGQRHLKDLKQKRKATNNRLGAMLYISSLRNDLGYFKTTPRHPTHFTGNAWRHGPSVWKGKVLKSESMKPLPGQGNRSKAFLAEFKSGHVGMVQRVVGSKSRNTTTQKSGKPRWRNRQGKVEKLVTLGSPSATAMHNMIWPGTEPEVAAYLLNRLDLQVQKVLQKARNRRAGR